MLPSVRLGHCGPVSQALIVALYVTTFGTNPRRSMLASSSNAFVHCSPVSEALIVALYVTTFGDIGPSGLVWPCSGGTRR
jgi:hypothetical protein